MKAKINITYRDKNGNIIVNPTEGEKAYSPETQCLYTYTNGKWERLTGEGGLKVTSYELNKQLIAQLENIENNEEAVIQAIQTIQDFGRDIKNQYYMLLCKDISYYTIFHDNRDPMNEDLKPFAEEVIDCVHDVGAIKSVEETGDGAIEIWAQPIGEDPLVMYLFPYDQGVIECAL